MKLRNVMRVVSAHALLVLALIGICLSDFAYASQAGKTTVKKDSTKKFERVDLTKIPSPQVLAGNENNHYRDPTAIYHDGVFRLFFTVNQPRDNKKYMVSFLGTITSRDLLNWTPVKLLTPEEPALNYSSPGNIIRYNGEWTICFQTYPIPSLEGFGGDGTARLFIMRSKDLENWSEPELLKVKGPDVPRERMGRMIDPYLIKDKDEPGKWWCFYKQNGVSMSYSYDLKTWKYFGRQKAGENSCVLVLKDRYYLIHSPGRDGMGLMSSKDLKNWKPVVEGTIKLGYKVWGWAMARLTAGFALDLKGDRRVGKYLMFYHGTESENPHEHIGICSLGIAWSDDLINWSWPKKPEE
ncbi:MAG: glycoside hydrolase family protein [Planctomycetota bacterium]